MSDVQTSPACGIHWWTAVFRCPVRRVLDGVEAQLGGDFGRVEQSGGFGQKRRVVHQSGVAVYFGSKREDQPIVVNATGEVCEDVAPGLVKLTADLGGYPSRLDVALDLEPTTLARRRILEMHRAWRRGQVVTAMHPTSIDFHVSRRPGDGATFVCGGKQSGLLLRAYDRRGPLRLEFQWRPVREIGEDLPVLIEQKGPAGIWQGLAKRVLFPMEWWRKLVVSDGVEFGAIVEDTTTFAKAAEATRMQSGILLWAAQTAGVALSDFVKVPGDDMKGEIARKLMAWADDLTEMGYDGDKVKSEVRCKLKSRRVRV